MRLSRLPVCACHLEKWVSFRFLCWILQSFSRITCVALPYLFQPHFPVRALSIFCSSSFFLLLLFRFLLSLYSIKSPVCPDGEFTSTQYRITLLAQEKASVSLWSLALCNYFHIINRKLVWLVTLATATENSLDGHSGMRFLAQCWLASKKCCFCNRSTKSK